MATPAPSLLYDRAESHAVTSELDGAPMMDYLSVLERRKQALPRAFERGSPAEREALERFATFFADFSPDKVERLVDLTYAEDIWFNDTLKTIEGRENLRHYLRHSAEAVAACAVRILDTVANDGGDYYLRWAMTIRFKRFRRGIDTHSIGISHLRFDRAGRVHLQQDYWDAASALFEHVPLLGAGIRAIKRRV
jgi:limonene-1,2-epoxide hydrolase